MSRGVELRPSAYGLRLPWLHLSGERTDRSIEQDVVDTIRCCPTLKKDEIQVSVKDGEVTLTGKVAFWDNRRLAADAAWSVDGVKDVQNSLIVEKL